MVREESPEVARLVREGREHVGREAGVLGFGLDALADVVGQFLEVRPGHGCPVAADDGGRRGSEPDGRRAGGE